MFEDPDSEEKTAPPPTPPKLPPPPPLSRAPATHYRTSCTSLTERAGPSPATCSVTKTVVRLTERKYPPHSDGVSKLVMKNISHGTRKKALIHSIPKFSQVLPNQQLTEVQRVLQERLLKKKVKYDDTEHVSNNNVDRRASDILQSMVDMSGLVDRTDTKSKHRPRRGRKPHKTDICHLKPNSTEHMDEDTESSGLPQDSHHPVISSSRPHDWSSFLPEITITRKSSTSVVQDSVSPLDLSTTPACDQPYPLGHPSTMVPSTSLPFSLVLKPEEYETLAPKNPLYATYVFLPSVGVFVHPLAIPPELAPPHLIPVSSPPSSTPRS